MYARFVGGDAGRWVAVVSGAAVGVAGIAVGRIALVEFGSVGAQVGEFAGQYTVATKGVNQRGSASH